MSRIFVTGASCSLSRRGDCSALEIKKKQKAHLARLEAAAHGLVKQEETEMSLAVLPARGRRAPKADRSNLDCGHDIRYTQHAVLSGIEK